MQHRALDGRHRYHRLAREWFSHALLQRSAQEYQVSRRALVNYYRRQLARLEQDVGQQLSTSTVWLELAQALVYQLLCSPGDASHTSAVEQSLGIVHMAKHKADIISLLRACLQEPAQIPGSPRSHAQQKDAGLPLAQQPSTSAPLADRWAAS